MELMELGFVVVTHGRVGEELLRVATHIMGRKLGNVRAVVVPFMAEAEDAFASATPFETRRQWLIGEIRGAVTAVDTGAGVLILTDIVGGTAFNASRSLLAPSEGIVVAGVNLPMLLKIPSVRTLEPAAAAAELVSRSRRAIEQRPPEG
jgi:PTS system mannose-specific IIA component